MTARSGPWREVTETGGWSWSVRNATAGEAAITPSGRVRIWSRRAHAYAHAERLNREAAERQAEELAALGL